MSKLEEKLAKLRQYYRRTGFGLLHFGLVRRNLKNTAKRARTHNIIRLEHDLLCRIDTADKATRRMWLRGSASPDLDWVLRKYVRPGTAAVDVGSNIGLVALLMAHYTGPQGLVASFEPNAQLLSRIQDNFMLNGFHHLQLHNKACGPSAGRISFQVDPDDHTKSRVNENAAGGHVDMVALDEVFADLEKTISLIKIDVEGFEADVLAGAVNMLKAHQPAVVFETGMHDAAQVARLSGYLGEAGYEVIGVLQPWGIISMPLSTRMTDKSHCNVLALPKFKAART